MIQACNFHTLTLPLRWAPHQYLVLPAGFDSRTALNETAPEFSIAPAELYDRLKAVTAGEPRIEWLVEDRTAGRMELIVRSRVFRFPDLVSIAVLPAAGGPGATLAVYGRQKSAKLDFGVNGARTRRWLKALSG